MNRNPTEINAIMDAQVNTKLTREQCLEILDAPRGASMVAFAKKFNVRVAFVQHVRYKCKWMRTSPQRPREF